VRRLQIAPPCPTASKLALAFACPASALLSRDAPDRSSAAASWGDLVHRGAAWLYNGQSWIDTLAASLPETTPDEQAKFERQLRVFEEQYAIDTKTAPTVGDWHVEAGYAYDLQSGRVNGPYQRRPGEGGAPWQVCGSADLVFRRDDGVLVVRDWKPDDGKTARIADPSTHHQLWFLALCASRAHGIGAGVVVQLAYYSERGIWIEEHPLSQSTLREFEAQLLELAAALDAYPQPRPGWYCEGLYCPAHTTMCNASVALVERTVAAIDPLPVDLLRRTAQTPEEARRQHQALRVLKKVLSLLEEHVRAFAMAHGPIPLAYGVELAAKVVKGRDEVLDTPEALKAILWALDGAGKDDIGFDDFTSRTTSKAQILDCWAKRSGKKKSSADAKKFVAMLREKGLIVEGAPHIRLEETAGNAHSDEGEADQ